MEDETTWNMMEREPCVNANKRAHLVNQTVRVLNVLFPAVDVLRSVRRSRTRVISISSTMGDPIMCVMMPAPPSNESLSLRQR